LQGKTMLPAFLDPHSHINQVGLLSSGANIFAAPDGKVNSIKALVETLIEFKRSKPATLATTGWLFSMGFDDSLLSDGRFPTAEDLDKVSTDVPVYIIHQSGHLGVLNNKALAAVGITDCTKEIKGGSIGCISGTTKPNGILEENANIMVVGKFLSKITPELYDVMFEQSLQTYASFGYTTAQEGRAFKPMIDTAIRAAKKAPLLLDVVMYPDFTELAEITPPYLTGSGYDGIRYINGFRFGGIKVTLDGSPQGKTAWLTKPYYKVPEGKPASYSGYAQLTDKEVFKLVDDAFKNKMQILAHCNGDAAIDQYINAIAAATKKYGKADRRVVIIHAQTLRPDQIPRLKELDIIPSLYPMHTFYWGDWHRDSVLGPKRAAFISPTKAVLDAGMIFTSHTDAPVTPPNAMRVLSATVTRETRSGKILGPDQRVSPYVALKSMITWSAYQHFEDRKKGTISVGKEADFVILSDNPVKVEHSKIIDIKVLATINNGKYIYQAKPLMGADSDVHGCKSSAGYAWCNSTHQCERSWELAKNNKYKNTPESFKHFCKN
ncbi:MAG: amidohydrolase, partial [Sinobacterium sp.]|nr:amidohydrolase [Sinobacterium sp.]